MQIVKTSGNKKNLENNYEKIEFENMSFNFKKIDVNILDTDLNFLEGHFITAGRIEFRLLPGQKYDNYTFNNKYWKKFVKNIKEYIDFIASYYIDSNHGFNENAFVIFKLKNDYWVYVHIYGECSGLEYWGGNIISCYCNKNLDYLIRYGISIKDYKKLGIYIINLPLTYQPLNN